MLTCPSHRLLAIMKNILRKYPKAKGDIQIFVFKIDINHEIYSNYSKMANFMIIYIDDIIALFGKSKIYTFFDKR